MAKDRFWFGDDYTPFSSVLEDGLVVEGIGSVTLATKKTPTGTGRNAHATLHLANVLHAPRAVCNILGRPIAFEYMLETNFQDPSRSAIRDQSGQPLAYFRNAYPGGGLQALRLSGPPVGPKVGPSSLDPSATYYLNATWSDAERGRWATAEP